MIRRLPRDERGTVLETIGVGYTDDGATYTVQFVAMRFDGFNGYRDFRMIVQFESDVDQRYDVPFGMIAAAAIQQRQTERAHA